VTFPSEFAYLIEIYSNHRGNTMSVMNQPVQAHSVHANTSVMIVDDHPALCEGLGHRIGSQPDMSICGQAADVGEALAKVEEIEPSVVIVDIALRDSDGLELLKAIKLRYPKIRLLVHSMYEESLYADRCLRAGAMGYVNKEANPQEVITAIREIVLGRVYLTSSMKHQMLDHDRAGCAQTDDVGSLTDRQLEIFRLIGGGLSTSQIANRLHISVHTVETHRENIKHKLGCECSRDLNRRAILWVLGQR
jgi:DNA-binding NarL/FixJ family response regulator